MAMMRGNLDNIPQTLMREPQKTSYMAASMRPFGPAEEKIQSGNEEPGNVFQSRQLVFVSDQHHSGDNTEDCCLQKAVEEMKRLDEMLSLETWKEKEIRLERKVLQAKLWQDLLNNSQEHSECALEALNTKQFLALEACVGRDDFVSVFKTEIPDYQNDGGQHDTKKTKKKPDSLNESFEKCSEDVGDSQPKNCHYEATKNKSTQKDFIRRNIKLIRGEVGQVLLTRAEKERLAELLRQIDEEEEDSARGAESEANSSKAGWKWDGDRQPGEKVLQDIKERREQKRRLQEIEQQLETLDRSQEMTNASPSLTEEQLLMLLNECELTENRTKCHEISG
ncbi:fibrous sheath-interacting protein 1 isoform X4 [Oryzias melastigma]|uniref:fibrous sheath-interacting protein 1 isoform X4 n=1 Tax=Oryzias melastigma TaxID=30732 RepID=UPI000CF7D6C4|nr:fibrous sheath-interacting protein 1 isoform X4 [Oryzias melastigma]